MCVFLAAITSWLIRPVNCVLSYAETNEGDIPGAVCLRPYTAPCLGKCLLLKDAVTLIPRRPSTPILDLTCCAPTILADHRAAKFIMEPSLWYPYSPSLVRVRVDLYIT